MSILITRHSCSLALSAAVIAALITGCSKYSAQTISEEEERTTLRVELFDRSDDMNRFDTYDIEPLKKWIQAEFGEANNTDIEFVSVSRKNETDDLNKFIAAGNGPDILFTYNPYYFGSYAMNNQLTDLTEVIDEYGANLKAFLGDDLLRQGSVNGHQYAVPAKRMFTGKYTSYIRKDWLDALGLNVPETTDELIYTLRRFKELDNGSKNIIPFSSQYGNSGAIKLFLQNRCMDSSDDDILHFSGSRYKQGMKMLNALYNDGILGSDYPLDVQSTAHYMHISEGNVGFFVDGISNVSFRRIININEMIKQNDPNAEYIACDPISSSSGAHFKEVNSETGMYIFVPAYSTKAELAVKYLDWMAQPEVLKELHLLMSDKENIHSTDYFDISIIVNGFYADTKEESLDYEAKSYGDYSGLFREACRISETDGFNHDNPPEETIANGNSDRTAKLIDKYAVKCITAPAEDFDSVYDEAAAEFFAENE